MNKKSLQPGYIIPLTLMILSISIGLLTLIYQRAMMYQREVNLTINQEKARILALSGLEIARSQISFLEQKTAEGTEKTQEGKEQRWLAQLLGTLNHWQTFILTEKDDGVSGIIQLYITCEQGKININSLLPSDEKQQGTQQQPSDQKTLLFINALAQKEFGILLSDVLKQLTKSTNRTLEDPTELLRFKEVPSLGDFLFPDPQWGRSSTRNTLTDLFSTVGTKKLINPWLLSPSTTRALGLKAQIFKKELVVEYAKKIKPKMNWSQDWNSTLASYYGKDFSALPPDMTALFDTAFEPTAFSVLCYAKVGTITQKIYALVEKGRIPPELSQKSVLVKTAKVYWLT